MNNLPASLLQRGDWRDSQVKVDGQHLRTVETPAAVLDRFKFEANCARMIDRVHSLGSKLRPHMKTLKSMPAARGAIDPAHGGIAVATLNEAAYFAHHGVHDICYAICIAPDKLDRAAGILRTAPDFSFFVDSVETARAVAMHGVPFNVWIEIDSGEHRTGIDAASPLLTEIAETLTKGNRVTLMGVATHAGQSYRCRSVEEIRSVAERERLSALEAAARLRVAGFPVSKVSIGSTPTTVHAVSGEGITEFRAGVYMVGDLMQATIGSLALDEIAFSILATVVSRDPDRRGVVVDAGGLALSKDRSSQSTHHDYRFGLVTDLAGQRTFGELLISGVHQEHGEIYDVPREAFERLTIGSKVRVIPNHVCMTAAMYENIFVIDNSEPIVVAAWPRTNGWS